MFDFARADSKGDCTKGAVGGCVRVPADNCHSRLGQSQFWSDNVNYALVFAPERIKMNIKFLAILAKGLDLDTRDRIFNGLINI
jgi:hypothetical protein